MTALDALDAIRHRRAVRTYTDRPVAAADLDRLLRLALLAPTGHGAQSWSFVVVREPERRAALAELVLRGAAEYFRIFRPPAEGASEEEHAAWARGYAEKALGSYRQVPVWICAVIVPRFHYPDDPLKEHFERFGDVTSLAFALENLFVAARAIGLGTTPTIFHVLVEDGVPRAPAAAARAGRALPDPARLPAAVPRRAAPGAGEGAPTVEVTGPRRGMGAPPHRRGRRSMRLGHGRILGKLSRNAAQKPV